jgi:hypothetical protein
MTNATMAEMRHHWNNCYEGRNCGVCSQIDLTVQRRLEQTKKPSYTMGGVQYYSY